MDLKLAQVAALGPKDKAAAYQALVADTFARAAAEPTSSSSSSSSSSAFAADLRALVESVANQDSVVVGRQVLADVVRGLRAVEPREVRKRAVEDALAVVQPRLVSYEEQVRPPSFAILRRPLTSNAR
jgi:COP9 signalosome complex subunit 4